MDIQKTLLHYCDEQSGVMWSRIARQIKRGGKRLRPRLCLGAYEVYGGTDEKIIDMAAAWEMMHLGLLIHDDIMDGDYLRHGEPNIAGEQLIKTGSRTLARNKALLAGDLCLDAAHDLLNRSGFNELRPLFRSVFTDVIEGQRMDVLGGYDPLEVARLKTASYTYIGPLVSGAMAAGASNEQIHRLRKAGEYLGIAYQLQNDLDDIEQDQRAGKQTAVTQATNDLGSKSEAISMITDLIVVYKHLAEREGFEPSMELPPYRLSKAAH